MEPLVEPGTMPILACACVRLSGRLSPFHGKSIGVSSEGMSRPPLPASGLWGMAFAFRAAHPSPAVGLVIVTQGLEATVKLYNLALTGSCL